MYTIFEISASPSRSQSSLISICCAGVLLLDIIAIALALLSSLLCIQYVSQVLLMLADQLDNSLSIIFRRVSRRRRLLPRYSHDLLPFSVIFAALVIMIVIVMVDVDRDRAVLLLILNWPALIYTVPLRGESGDRRFVVGSAT